MIIFLLIGIAIIAAVVKVLGVSHILHGIGKFILLSGVYVVFLTKVVKALLFRHH